ncbi:MAG: PH domain-containing protein [Chloroflexi bacterium]|nr:PH domain-containing protein [Chloroflexota bacterium]
MPRKYLLYQDRLRIVLGRPFGIDIPYTSIKEVKRASGARAYIYAGIRFATSSRYVVEILRKKGFNYVISPQNGDYFIEQLNRVMKSEAGRWQ